MKIKYIGAIFLYFTTFTLSVLLVGLPTPKSHLSPIRPVAEQPVLVVKKAETDLQKRLRKFLEDDYQTGIELANDKARLSQSKSSSHAEKQATSNLVEKMKKVKCENLPADFCLAWDAHVEAWRDVADFNENYEKIQSRQENYRALNYQIGHTYRNMLTAARKHGVDFRY